MTTHGWTADPILTNPTPYVVVPGAGEEATNGPERLWLARLQAIGGSRCIARFAPFLLIDKGERMFCVSARLPAANRISNRPCHEETDCAKNYERD